MAEWKKEHPIMPEYEKKRFAKAERNISEADKKMLRAEAKLVEIRKIL